METEGEIDTGSDADTRIENDNKPTKSKPTPAGKNNLFHIDDEKSWNDREFEAAAAEARDMKRQLKHYITQSNVHDIKNLPDLLHMTQSDLESGAEMTDAETAGGPATSILFPVKRKRGSGNTNHTNSNGNETSAEAETVRAKLDSVQSSVNTLIENLETEKHNIKDKKLLQFLQDLQHQLTGVQDNVEDAESELKSEEKKYQHITKEYEKTSKKYNALKERQEREEREKQEKIIKEQEKKLAEQQALLMKWQSMAIQNNGQTSGGPNNVPLGMTPAFGPNQKPITPHGGPSHMRQATNMTLGQGFTPGPTGPLPGPSPRMGGIQPMQQMQQQQSLDAIPQEPSVFGLDQTNNNNNGNIPDDHQTVIVRPTSPLSTGSPNALPITHQLNHPSSPAFRRGRDKHRGRNSGRNNSRSASRGKKIYGSQSGDSSAAARMNEPPQIISDLPSDDDPIFGQTNINKNRSYPINLHDISRTPHNHQNQRQSHRSHNSDIRDPRNNNHPRSQGNTPHNFNGNFDPATILAMDSANAGHRSSNEMDDPPPMQQMHVSQSQPQVLRQGSNHSNNNNSNHNRYSNNNMPQQQQQIPMNTMNNNMLGGGMNMINTNPLSISSSSRAGNSIPNQMMMGGDNNMNNSGGPRGSNGTYQSPQPGYNGMPFQSEGPGYSEYQMYNNNNGVPIVSYNDNGPSIDYGYDPYNNNMDYGPANDVPSQIQSTKERPLISDTGIKIIGGTIVFVAAVYIISKYMDKNNNGDILPQVVRRPPRPRY